VILVQYDFYASYFKLTYQYKDYHFTFKLSTLEELDAIISKLSIKELFVNNLVSYKNIFQVLEYLIELAKDEETSLIIPIHDMYAQSPSYNLLNNEGFFNTEDCLDHEKMSANMQEWRNFYDDEVDMPRWKATWTKLLENSQILCFSESSKHILLKSYPDMEDKITVIPHTVEGIHPVMLEKDPRQLSL